MHSTTIQPARHFRPLSARQRTELMQRIDATEHAALGTVRGQPVSEGTATAMRLIDTKAPLTDDRFLLRPEAPALHRVHAIQATKPAHACTSGMCAGDAACPDRHCQGHPVNEVTESNRDARLSRYVWGGYALLMVLALVIFTR